MPKVAPGVRPNSAKPNRDIWFADEIKDNDELMLATMQWKLSLKADKKLPSHRMPSRFHLNKIKS
jgi:hypothetical protein